jgi:hypothetical protein
MILGKSNACPVLTYVTPNMQIAIKRDLIRDKGSVTLFLCGVLSF